MIFHQHKNTFVCLAALFYLLLTGCDKNYTHYYADTETPGVAIFSDKGNNVMSCLVNNRPWRTVSRIFHAGEYSSYTSYEVFITRFTTGLAADTLLISWAGDIGNQPGGLYEIDLVYRVAKTFNLRDLSALQGKRLSIDSSNGYFTINMNKQLLRPNPRGRGQLYINSLSLDSSAASGGYQGYLSGLLEADIDTFKIRSGRFDHTLTAPQILYR